MSIDWEVDRFGTYTARLPHGLGMTVSYEGIDRLKEGEPRYNVFVFGARMKVRSASAEEGKERAERLAKQWLTEALARFDAPSSGHHQE
jgi:hypothetical protein